MHLQKKDPQLVKLILKDLEEDPVIKEHEEFGFIKAETKRFLKGKMSHEEFKNLKLLTHQQEIVKRLTDIIQYNFQKFYYTEYRKWSLDIPIKKLLKGPAPFETELKVHVPDPLIKVDWYPYEGEELFYNRWEDHPLTATIIIPPWSFDPKLHAIMVKGAQRKGPVMVFPWKKETISADVATTAESFRIMHRYIADHIKKLVEISERHHIKRYAIVTASAGSAITAGALKILHDEGNPSFFDSASAYCVCIADRFAECYLFGMRTMHIGDAARRAGWTLDQIRKAFDHMAPVKGIPAFSAMKGGVSLFISPSDLYFPIKSQEGIAREAEQYGKGISVVNIPGIGHVGMTALYFLLGAGNFQKKNLGSALSVLMRQETRLMRSKIMDPLRIENILDRIIDRAMGYALPKGIRKDQDEKQNRTKDSHFSDRWGREAA